MSAKFKLSSNCSTPAKVKNSDETCSSIKSSKYRSFWAVLTPSRSKKRIKQKTLSKSKNDFEVINDGSKQIENDNHLSDDSDEPGYSSIQDLQLRQRYHQKTNENSTPLIASKHVEQSSQQNLYKTTAEPVYATVNKKKKQAEVIHDDYMCNKGVIEEHKKEIQLLQERLKEVTSENRELRKNIETILKEEKWKEESLHADLKLKISQLETDTHKEVNCLSDQIKSLQKEREVLMSEIDVLYTEKKELKQNYNELSYKAKSMVSPEFLKKTTDEHQRLLNEMQKKLLDDIKSLQQQNEVLTDSKLSLEGEMDGVKEKLKTLIIEKESIKNLEQELRQENVEILHQLEESKQMQQEAQNLLLSLLKITESISMEREILFNKTTYQDQQQNMLKSSIMNYSLNMGRLQEHISNLSKEKLDELEKFKTGKYLQDESLRDLYGKQVELLRSKVLNQNNTINELESEKSKLELQLESLWQAACTGKPKVLEDIKY